MGIISLMIACGDDFLNIVLAAVGLLEPEPISLVTCTQKQVRYPLVGAKLQSQKDQL